MRPFHAALSACLPVLACLSVLVVLAACTNRPLVQVCDPCGCKCVAAPLLTGSGPIPRVEDGAPGEEAAAQPTDVQPAEKRPAYEPSANEKAAGALAQKKMRGLRWEGTNLDQAIAYLRTVTGLAFQVSKKAREEKAEEIVYDLALDDVTVQVVLDLMTRPYGLRWELRDGEVWLLTREEIDGPKRLRYFDVHDLAEPVDASASGADLPPGTPRKEPAPNCEHLVDLIRSGVFPAYWEQEDALLECRNGILIVRASQAVKEEIERRLARERRGRAPKGIPADLQKVIDETKVSVALKDATVAQAVQALQLLSGLNLHVDPRIQADVGERPVAGLAAQDVAVSAVMDRIAAAAGEDCLWMARGRVLVLTLREYADEE